MRGDSNLNSSYSLHVTSLFRQSVTLKYSTRIFVVAFNCLNAFKQAMVDRGECNEVLLSTFSALEYPKAGGYNDKT